MPTFDKYAPTSAGFTGAQRQAISVAINKASDFCHKMAKLLSVFQGQTVSGVGATDWKVRIGKMVNDVFNITPHKNLFDNERVMKINAVYKHCPEFLPGARFMQMTDQQLKREGSPGSGLVPHDGKPNTPTQSTNEDAILAIASTGGWIGLSPSFFKHHGESARALVLIHEYVHLVRRKQSPWADSHPGMESKTSQHLKHLSHRQRLGIPYHLAVDNPYCYTYFVAWSMNIPSPSSTIDFQEDKAAVIKP